MERKKATDFPQEVLNLFDLYVHGDIDRRAFIDRAQKFATGSMTAAVMLDLLKPNYAWAQQVAKDDKRINVESVDIASPQGNGHINGYLVHPVGVQKAPGVLVVHENRGRNPYIEDVARRLGAAGFLAVAPDGLTTVGGYPGDEQKATQLFQTVPGPKMTEDFVASAMWLKNRPDCTGKIGVVGFCYGGGIANQLAVRLGSDLAAAAPFYGAQPMAADAAKIKAAMLLHYGSLDARITGGWPAWEAALKANNVKYEGFVYEGANHGFHNDTTPRYDEAAAKLAWQRTIDFFNRYLKS